MIQLTVSMLKVYILLLEYINKFKVYFNPNHREFLNNDDSVFI
jgi:hypothetical protein